MRATETDPIDDSINGFALCQNERRCKPLSLAAHTFSCLTQTRQLHLCYPHTVQHSVVESFVNSRNQLPICIRHSLAAAERSLYVQYGLASVQL